MKLRNKKTGEIVECTMLTIDDNGYPTEYEEFDKGDSLAELNEEWEDYKEEPRSYWCINWCGGIDEIICFDAGDTTYDKAKKTFGNYFETKEEAERVLEKLKAWKKLKDAGVSFKPTTVGHKWYLEPHASPENRTFKESQDLYKDVMLFFGGEDDKK